MIILPWPDRRLSPNARMHWAPLAKVKAAAREAAGWTTLAMPAQVRQAVIQGDGPIAMRVTFFPPDNRSRDRDNMIASLKAATDGIADGLGVNDARFVPTYAVGPAEKPGRVEVTFG